MQSLTKNRVAIKIGLLTAVIFLFSSCLKDKTIPYSPDHLVLKWHKSYADDSLSKAVTGLNWALSHIGAKNKLNPTDVSTEKNEIMIFPDELGLPAYGKDGLTKLHNVVFNTTGYHEENFFDLGHYVALLIGSSEHYYRLVNQPQTLSELEENYEFVPALGYVSDSDISEKPREIKFTAQDGFRQLFVSQEIDPETGEVVEFETLDLMPNGQPRFGIYDANGNRINGANPIHSGAGKPGKCMWCHESSIQPLFSVQAEQEGYLTPEELTDTLLFFRTAHKTNQNMLTSGIQFNDAGGHILMELVYISYMEPSLSRLALEWNMSETDVTELLSGVPTHEHEEFSFLGEVYHRRDVISFAPFKTLGFPGNIREVEGEEVNYLE